MHQGEPDFDLDLSVNDVTTSVQHVTPDLAKAPRERHATHHLPEFKSNGEDSREAGYLMSLSGTNTCDDTVHVTGNWIITTVCREYTSTRDTKGSKPIGIIDENTAIGPALDVQVTPL